MKIATIVPLAVSAPMSSLSGYAHALQRIEKGLKKRGHAIARFELNEGDGSSSVSFAEFAKVHDVDIALGFGGLHAAVELLTYNGSWGLFIVYEDLPQFAPPMREELRSALHRAQTLLTDDARVNEHLSSQFPYLGRLLHYVPKAVAPIAPDTRGAPQDLGLPLDAQWFLLASPVQGEDAEEICSAFHDWHRADARCFLVMIGVPTESILPRAIARQLTQAGVVHLPPLSPATFAYAISQALAVIDAGKAPCESPLVLQAMHQKSVVAASTSRRPDRLQHEHNCLTFSDTRELLALCHNLVYSNKKDEIRKILGPQAQQVACGLSDDQRESESYAQVIEQIARTTSTWTPRARST